MNPPHHSNSRAPASPESSSPAQPKPNPWALAIQAGQEQVLANVREIFFREVQEHHALPEPQPPLGADTHQLYRDLIAPHLHVLPWYNMGRLLESLALYTPEGPPCFRCYVLGAWHIEGLPELAALPAEQPQEELLQIMEEYAVLAEGQNRYDYFDRSRSNEYRDESLVRLWAWLDEHPEVFVPCLEDGKWKTGNVESFLFSQKRRLLVTIKAALLFRDVRVFTFFPEGDDSSSALRDLQRFWTAYRYLPEEDLYGFGPYHFMIHAGAPHGPLGET